MKLKKGAHSSRVIRHTNSLYIAIDKPLVEFFKITPGMKLWKYYDASTQELRIKLVDPQQFDDKLTPIEIREIIDQWNDQN